MSNYVVSSKNSLSHLLGDYSYLASFSYFPHHFDFILDDIEKSGVDYLLVRKFSDNLFSSSYQLCIFILKSDLSKIKELIDKYDL